MAQISDLDLRKHLDSRAKGLRAMREPWDDHAEELSRYYQARRTRHLRTSTSHGTTADSRRKGWVNQKLYNSKPLFAAEVLGNGMSAGLCSPSQPWFGLETVDDPEMMEYRPVKEWLALAERQIYALLARSGFYPAATAGFIELGIFGTEASLMVPHWEHGAACFPQTWGEYWIGQNDAHRTDTLMRRADMTVAQLYARFPQGKFSRRIREAHDKGEYDKAFEIMHLVEPNREREYGKVDRTNMAWRSVYWEPASQTKDGVIAFGGFEDRPFWASRWDVVGGELYSSRSPGMRGLPDARKLQLQELRKQQAMDYVVKPPVLIPSNIEGGRPTLNPGTTVSAAPSDMVQPQALWTVDPRAVQFIAEDIARTEALLDMALHNDVFRAFTNMDGSAYKNVELIARKHEEQLTQLGPVVDRASNEKLEPAVDQAFGIVLKAGLLPPPPEELSGANLKVQFHGILAQAQRMIALGSIERTAAFVGNLAAANPSILDKFDFDQAVDEYGSIVDAPPKIIRSDEEVEKLREARQQAEQQERMAAMMPAVKDGADAARILSETDTGGGRTVLQNLAQGIQV